MAEDPKIVNPTEYQAKTQTKAQEREQETQEQIDRYIYTIQDYILSGAHTDIATIRTLSEATQHRDHDQIVLNLANTQAQQEMGQALTVIEQRMVAAKTSNTTEQDEDEIEEGVDGDKVRIISSPDGEVLEIATNEIDSPNQVVYTLYMDKGLPDINMPVADPENGFAALATHRESQRTPAIIFVATKNTHKGLLVHEISFVDSQPEGKLVPFPTNQS